MVATLEAVGLRQWFFCALDVMLAAAGRATIQLFKTRWLWLSDLKLLEHNIRSRDLLRPICCALLAQVYR